MLLIFSQGGAILRQSIIICFIPRPSFLQPAESIPNAWTYSHSSPAVLVEDVVRGSEPHAVGRPSQNLAEMESHALGEVGTAVAVRCLGTVGLD